MHPTLARFLDLETAQQTLSRGEQGAPLDDEERAFVRASQHAAEQARLVRRAQKARPSPDSQRALLFLALHAAADSLRADALLQAKLDAARSAVVAAGGSTEAADGTIAALLSEEAFGYEDEADGFDRAFFEETLELLPPLLALTPERLAALRAEFLLNHSGAQRAAAERAWQTLLQVAWSDGVEPFQPEQLAEARELLSSPEEEAMLQPVLELMHRRRLLGPLRLKRLAAALRG